MEKLAEQAGLYIDRSQISDIYLTEVRKDDKLYNVVDGEEGDWGIIDYYIDNNLCATYVNNGGDNDYYNFTSWGVNYLKYEILRLITGKLLEQIVE